jgi:hypothetical protein
LVQHFLEKHEHLLPVRAVWLAWTHLVQLSQGDVLAIARARDRLMERLYQDGLRAERDLPSFLRFSAQVPDTRHRGLGPWLTDLCDWAHIWAEENGRSSDKQQGELSAPMQGYIDLLFAFGLARLGERDAGRQLLQRGAAKLRDDEPVHAVLLKAFEYRVRQSLDGKPHSGPLPDEYYQEVHQLGTNGRNGVSYRYIVERLGCQLRVLEPNQVINPYLRELGVKSIARSLAAVSDLTDKTAIAAQIEHLWQMTPKGAKGASARALIVREALNLAPRVGEDFSRIILQRALTILDALPFPPPGLFECTDYLELLTKALYVAAHFDRAEILPALVARFKKALLPDMEPEPLLEVARAANHCFRGLRKMGMRDEIQELLAMMSHVTLGGRHVTSIEVQEMAKKPHQLVALLEVAGAWLNFGEADQAEQVLKVAKEVLFQNELPPQSIRTALTKSYIAALGRSPVESTKARLQDVLTNLRGIRDTYNCNIYYISQSQLEVIEAIILAVTHDDFALGPTARRWLEDDEFLVRQRIHRDVRALIGTK